MEAGKTLSGSRMERKKEETRRKIVAAAVEFFHELGYESTTMEQIADRADIAKGTLYHYFPVKEAVLSAYIRQTFQEKNARRILELERLPDTRSRLTALLAELIRGVEAQKEIFETFLAYQMRSLLSLRDSSRERSGIEQLSRAVIRMGQQSGEIRGDLPEELLEDQFNFVFVEVARQLFLTGDAFDAARVIDGCVDLFLNGASARR